jgi:hypothetical protein
LYNSISPPRTEKELQSPCKAYRERYRLEEEEDNKVKQTENQQRAAEAATRSPQKKPAGGSTERLPDGAKFDVVYDANRTQWTGTLTIGKKVFTGSAGGVFKLLSRLDQQYRESLPPALPKNPG